MSEQKTRFFEMTELDDFRVQHHFTALDVIQQWAYDFFIGQTSVGRLEWFHTIHEEVITWYGEPAALKIFGGEAASAKRTLKRFEENKPNSTANNVRLVAMWLCGSLECRERLKAKMVLLQPHHYLRGLDRFASREQVLKRIEDMDKEALDSHHGHDRFDPEYL